ncbi:MAG: hypothetical protein U9R77_08855 [Pseudomonadota bacterium]|nr:hypothetical protein [Pseudomonadota bacterium]
MMTGAAAVDAYVRRETRISMAINATLALLIFLAVFGLHRPVESWGVGGWVFDFLPQSFMIALMSVLIPGLLARQKLKKGALDPVPHGSILPGNLLARALVLAGASAGIGTALVAGLVWLTGIETINPIPALLFKVIYGAILALIVTPPALRAALAA